MRTMKSFRLIVLGLCVSLIAGGPCKTTKNIMDCKGKGLTDCPAANKSVTVLILDENNLTDLRTKNCKNWTNLISLSVRKNKLKNSLTFETFKVLGFLDLSENQLSSLALSGDQLSVVNVSSNFLSGLEVNLPNVLQLIASNNRMGKLNFGNLILDLHKSPSLTVLDVSRNRINSLPVDLMTFNNNKNLTINLSRNQLSYVNFNYFVDNKIGFNINFSFNRIADIDIDSKLHFGYLDFSNNQLSKVNGEKLDRFVNLNGIDFSQNPLSCFCNESESFINWMIKHKAIVVNPQNTMCKYPSKIRIFEVKCQSSTTTGKSSTSTVSTSTNGKSSTSPVSTSTNGKSSTSQSSASTKFTTTHYSTKKAKTTNHSSTRIVTRSTKNHTKSPKTQTKSWKIALGVILPIIGLIIIFVCYWTFCRRSNNYRRLDEQNHS